MSQQRTKSIIPYTVKGKSNQIYTFWRMDVFIIELFNLLRK